MKRACRSTTWILAVLTSVATGPARADDFTIGWELPEGSSSFGVTLGDVDNDGDLDAYVADFDGMDRLWLNNGSGVFIDSGQSLDTGRGTAPIFGLFDNDTFVDLWLTRHFSANRVWLNNGSGVLVDSGQSLGGNLSRVGVAAGDLDEDMNGDVDIFQPTDTNGPEEIFFGDGVGNFTDSGQMPGGTFARSVALGNVDGDGDLDALIGNNGFNRLWINNGSGVFTDSGQSLGFGGTFGVALAELDQVAGLDAFYANGSLTGDPNEVWLNDGAGTFTDSGQDLGNSYSFSVALFNADNDADIDAFVGNNAGQMDVLWLNNGDAVFTDSGQSLGVGGAISVAAGQLDGLGGVDVFVANRYQPDQVWLNDGFGAFTDSGQLLGSSQGASVAVGNLDGDEFPDAILGSVAGTARVLINDGTGQFTDSNQWLVNGFGNNNEVVVLGLFNADAHLDAFFGNSPFSGAADNANRVWFNDGNGVFTDSGQLLGSDNTGTLAVGNVDGGGGADVVVGNAPYNLLTGENRVWLNDGSGTFTDSGQVLGEGNTRAVVLADFDGSPGLDIFFGNLNGPNKVWTNNGSGTFADSGQDLGTDEDTFAAAAGELDGNPGLDLFIGNNGGNQVFLNDGSGTFSDSGQLLGFRNTQAVHLFDVDGDTDLDAWATNGGPSDQPNIIWINNGSGVFTQKSAGGPGGGVQLGNSASQDSGFADLDGDTDMDVFVSNSFGDHRVWLSQLAGDDIFADGFESGDTTAWSGVTP